MKPRVAACLQQAFANTYPAEFVLSKSDRCAKADQDKLEGTMLLESQAQGSELSVSIYGGFFGGRMHCAGLER
jgi:hypothetical protein